jgi:hypothetical protein
LIARHQAIRALREQKVSSHQVHKEPKGTT